MPIPSKIDPDFLKDSIVEVRFLDKINPDLIAGQAYLLLQKIKYKYSPGSFQPSGSNPTFRAPLLHKENIKISFQNNSIVFNHHLKYPLWKEFKREIISAYDILVTEGKIFEKPFRIGLRYINIFDEQNIFDLIKPKFNLNQFGEHQKNTHVKTEFIQNGCRVILNVGNGYVVEDVTKSVIDIDIIVNKDKEFYSKNEFLSNLDLIHEIEKEIVFEKLLKLEYLNSLNVKY